MPALPRAGWLGARRHPGSAAPGGGSLDVGLPVALVVAAGVGALGLVAACLRPREARPAAAFLLGFGAVALRAGLALALAPAAPPCPCRRWERTVVGRGDRRVVSRGDEQRAFLAPVPPGAGDEADELAGLRLAAAATRPCAPGDMVTLSGALEPPPPDSPGFAGFLAARGASGTLRRRALKRAADRTPWHGVEQLRRGVDDAIARVIPEPEAGPRVRHPRGAARARRPDVATIHGHRPHARRGHQRLEHRARRRHRDAPAARGRPPATARGLRRRPVAIAPIHDRRRCRGQRRAGGGHGRRGHDGARGGAARRRRSGACAGLCAACSWSNPGMIGDIGLQLSLAATAGLLALGGAAEPPSAGGCRGPHAGLAARPSGVSLAAQLATLPLILLHFGRLSVISPLANLLMAPLRASCHAGRGPGCRRAAGRAIPACASRPRREPARRGCPWRPWCAARA